MIAGLLANLRDLGQKSDWLVEEEVVVAAAVGAGEKMRNSQRYKHFRHKHCHLRRM